MEVSGSQHEKAQHQTEQDAEKEAWNKAQKETEYATNDWVCVVSGRNGYANEGIIYRINHVINPRPSDDGYVEGLHNTEKFLDLVPADKARIESIMPGEERTTGRMIATGDERPTWRVRGDAGGVAVYVTGRNAVRVHVLETWKEHKQRRPRGKKH